MKLTAEYLRSVRFTVRRGNTYDAREVDDFLDELIRTVEEMERVPSLEYTERLETVCEIRAEMTDRIMREILDAEKRLRPLVDSQKEFYPDS